MPDDRFKEVCEQAYSRQAFLSFLRGNLQFREEPVTRPPIEVDAALLYDLGFIETSDDKTLRVYEVHIRDQTNIARNRAGLRGVVAKTIDASVEGALAGFYKNQEAEWRLSFLTQELGISEKGGIIKKETATARYTYLLGPSVQTRTAQERLSKLHKYVSLSDIEDAFAVEPLNIEFYKELVKWYGCAKTIVHFPGDGTLPQSNNSTSLIRMTTRMLFVWFLKEKGLVNEDLFDCDKIKKKIYYDKESSYYKAILQNLFFATLNIEVDSRGFDGEGAERTRESSSGCYEYGKKSSNPLFKIEDCQVKELFNGTPFLNGGLFECLDATAAAAAPPPPPTDLDGFSSAKNNSLKVPNDILLGEEGLITLLKKYQFTVEESSTSDIQVALDPELLGRVFENLLALENTETSQQARKSTGSFYTPRDVVSYMAKDSLKEYLMSKTGLQEKRLDLLFDSSGKDLFDEEKNKILEAITSIKIIDPAVGSGAFLMGILQELLSLLRKVDSSNILYEKLLLEKARRSGNPDKRRQEKEIKMSFKNRESSYGRKLQLIKSCLYGVDIQPIAMQICKLRFFISLIVEQGSSKASSTHREILPLPNLETKFVAADALIAIKRDGGQGSLADNVLEKAWRDLRRTRDEYFNEHNPDRKNVLRARDKKIREAAALELERGGMASKQEIEAIKYDIYSQQTSAPWFDSGMMFGLKEGYDLVIGNPPYISLSDSKSLLAKRYQSCGYQTYDSRGDIYQLFYERGIQLLKQEGLLHYITSNKWARTRYGKGMRRYLASCTDPMKLINLGSQIFKAATVDTHMLLIRKRRLKGKNILLFASLAGKVSKKIEINEFEKLTVTDDGSPWVKLNTIEEDIKGKMERAGKPLKEWNRVRLFTGVTTGCNKAFVIAEGEYKSWPQELQKETKELSKFVLHGRDINRKYWANTLQQRLLYIPWHFPTDGEGLTYPFEQAEKEFVARYPLLHEYLLQYKPTLEGRAEAGIRHEWYAVQRTRDKDDLLSPKIVWQDIARNPKFACAEENTYILNSAVGIAGPNLFYLLGVLNSKIIHQYIRNTAVCLGNSSYRLTIQAIERIPIPAFNKKDRRMQAIVSYTRKAIKLAQNGKSTASVEQKIDEEVFDLYGLNQKEKNYLRKLDA